MLGKGDIHMQKNKAGLFFYTIHKIFLKGIGDLKIRSETLKLLEENIGENLHAIGLGNDFLDTI